MNSRVLVATLAVFVFRAAFGASQLIGNGGFESTGQAPWQFSGTFGPGTGIMPSPGEARSGNNVLLLGKTTGFIVQNAFQRISIPTNALSVTFSYFWNSSTAENFGTSILKSMIVNTNASQTVLAEVDTHFNNNIAYQLKAFDMLSFTGRTVDVYFQVQSGPGFGASTTFRIDDVSVLVLTAEDIPANDNFTNRAVVTNASFSLTATNVLASKEDGEPKHNNKNGGRSVWWAWTAPTNGVATLNTDGSTFDTLLAVYTGNSISNLTEVASDDDQENRGIVTSQVKFTATAGVQYQIAVDGKSGASGLAALNLAFAPDTKPPAVSISSPAAGARLTNDTVVVQGKASDNLALDRVEFRLENLAGTNSYQAAAGTNNWTATVTNLIPGPNVIRVRAFDTSGNVSATVTRSVTFAVVSPFTLTIDGGGTVTPNLNGQLLDVGMSYTVTAKPVAGQVFAGWTGDVTASAASLRFVMQSNMVLQANFVPNPFLPVIGAYQGLFYNTNTATHESSGFFAATLGSAGTFSAKIQLAGRSHSLSGQFSGLGISSNVLIRKGLTPVSVQLNLDFNSGIITGQFSDGGWTSQLTAHRAGFSKVNPSPLAGRYTLLIPGAATGTNQPGGDSYGNVIVDLAGNATLKGVLADGTKAAQKAALSANGLWPFYLSLYSGNGSMFGWLTLSNQVNSDITGTVLWFKLPQPASRFYQAGFTNETEAAGSVYQFIPGVPVLNFTEGEVRFENGNVSSFTNQIILGADSKVVNQSPNALTLAITTSTGLFKGSVTDPATGRSSAFTGVVLQKQNFGGGFFLGTNQVGRVYFGPQP